MQLISFSDNSFFYQNSQYPADKEGVENLLNKLWDSPDWDIDFARIISPEHENKFSEKAYWELLKILTATIAADTTED